MSSDASGVKTFVYAYISKKFKENPVYTCNEKTVGRGRKRFICEKQPPALESNNPELNSGSVPVQADIKIEDNSWQSQPQPAQKDGFFPRPFFDKEKIVDAEECDFTSDIHGGWTLENSKQKLNEYLQATRQKMGEVKYTQSGPDHHKSFIAELTVFAKGIRKQLYAREEGSNKQTTSRAVCLSLVRQLYHTKEIGPFTGFKAKNKSAEVPSHTVRLHTELFCRVQALLNDLQIEIDPIPPTIEEDKLLDIMVHDPSVDFVENPEDAVANDQLKTVNWAPPMANWNPWTGCNIDEGPEASMTLDQLSYSFSNDEKNKANNCSQYEEYNASRDKLPVSNFKQQILDLIYNHQVVLIRGQTGCGKTTQIPQFILDSHIHSGRGAECCVLVTQPRRISAISLAERVANERCEPIGQSVGYSVRFESVLPRAHGSILYCTVGTMARKMEEGLRGVSHIIIDEIHERDVNTDFMLIVIRDMLQVNKDLRVVLMSATIDVGMFREYFPTSEMLDLEGRMHPVTTYYLEDAVQMVNYKAMPLADRGKKRKEDDDVEVPDASDANCNKLCDKNEYPAWVCESMANISEKQVPFDFMLALLDHIGRMNIEGAILVFLPGWNIISMLRKFLKSHPVYGSDRFLILPLHSQVPREEQKLVFRHSRPGQTKIVLSTNIAESSITIDDVVFVIDSCLARQKVFNLRNNMTSYTTCWASRTNLEQRRGRAGRVRPGYTFHLCSKARYERLEAHATPEMLRTPLYDLALLIKLLRLGDIRSFLMRALQPPPLDAVIEAEFVLQDMKAFNKKDELTPLGDILARMPIEPRLGRMIICSTIFEFGGAASLLGAFASLGIEVFSISPDRGKLSFGQKKFDAHKSSDHLAALNAYQTWTIERSRSGEQMADAYCENAELNSSGLKMMDDAANQIRGILLNVGFPEDSVSDAPVNFFERHSQRCNELRFLLTYGLYPNVCYHSDKRKLFTQEGKMALLNKASVNCPGLTSPRFEYPYFIYGEKIRTQAVSCKGLTMISPLLLLLVGSRQAFWKPTGDPCSTNGTVLLDNWIPLSMDYVEALSVLALRPALEALLIRVCRDPNELTQLTDQDKELISVIRQLTSDSAYLSDLGDASRQHHENRGGQQHQRMRPEFGRPLLQGRRNKRADWAEDTPQPKRPFDGYSDQNPGYGYAPRRPRFRGRGYDSYQPRYRNPATADTQFPSPNAGQNYGNTSNYMGSNQQHQPSHTETNPNYSHTEQPQSYRGNLNTYQQNQHRPGLYGAVPKPVEAPGQSQPRGVAPPYNQPTRPIAEANSYQGGNNNYYGAVGGYPPQQQQWNPRPTGGYGGYNNNRGGYNNNNGGGYNNYGQY